MPKPAQLALFDALSSLWMSELVTVRRKLFSAAFICHLILSISHSILPSLVNKIPEVFETAAHSKLREQSTFFQQRTMASDLEVFYPNRFTLGCKLPQCMLQSSCLRRSMLCRMDFVANNQTMHQTCLPHCRNNVLCHHPNRCVCRRGFPGYRCKVSTVKSPLTSIQASSVPHLNHKDPSSPPEPEPEPEPEPAPSHIIRKLRVLRAQSGPAAVVTPLSSTRPAVATKTIKPPAGAPDLNPAETHNREGDAKTSHSGPVKSGDAGVKTEDKGGVSKVFLLQEENQASPKGPQEGRGVERTEEETPGINNILQPRTGDPEETTAGRTGLTTEETSNLKPDSEPDPGSQTQETLTKRNLDSISWSEGKVLLDLKESSKAEDESLIQQSGSESKMVEGLTTSKIPNLESNSRPETDKRLKISSEGRLEFDLRLKPEDRLNLEFNPCPVKEDRPDPESDPEPRGEKSLDVVVAEEKKKKKWEEVKVEGAKKQSLSLREAQVVLLRKTLSRGGRGDKMSALLMKHIEKERKKLLTVSSSSSSSYNSSSSSSVKTSVKSFHTQRGQYTVTFTSASGGVCDGEQSFYFVHSGAVASETQTGVASSA
ncbi:hypothetical protein L3Q82_004858 [Scortum barcoo]|uniref:Uncharacterized protein n=1 Tax=Scortum barcoo TaxID=214431 RepID=A0ACB8VE77_9TELE|nr:hypothetical protein L3Q82_004858 [Scortum barcoo]